MTPAIAAGLPSGPFLSNGLGLSAARPLGLNLSLAGPGLWYATRAAGVVTLVLLTASMVLGILNAARFAADRWPRFVVQGMHRSLSLLALVFLALHVLTTVADSYTPIRLADAIIPFLSPYKRFWLGLGAIASDLLIALVVTSLARLRLGHRSWRFLHWAGYLCWPIAIAHGLGTGTDHGSRWMAALTTCCVATVLAALAYRATYRIPVSGAGR